MLRGTCIYQQQASYLMDSAALYFLIEKYSRGEATPKEREQLQSWYESLNREETTWSSGSPDEEEVVRLRMLHSLRAHIEEISPYTVEPDALVEMVGSAGPVRGIRKIGRLAIAVSFFAAVCLILFFVWRQPDSNKMEWIVITNPAGKILRVNLPDSSVVWLNANSILRYAKNFGPHREVQLEGEGYFDVHPERESPFVVHTRQLTTRVLGTAFDVRAYPGRQDIQIAVESGKVAIRDQKARKDIGILLPDQELIFRGGEAEAEIRRSAKDLFSWRTGKLSFESQTWEEIALQLENWYGLRFSFTDESLKACQYDASFPNDLPLKDLLSLLCEINDTHWKIDEGKRLVTLSGKGCK